MENETNTNYKRAALHGLLSSPATFLMYMSGVSTFSFFYPVLDAVQYFPEYMQIIFAVATISLPGVIISILIDRVNSGWKTWRYYLTLWITNIIFSAIIGAAIFIIALSAGGGFGMSM